MLNPMIFMLKKNVSKKYDKQKSGKGKGKCKFLIHLILKLVVEIPVAMLLNLLMFSPKVKIMKAC